MLFARCPAARILITLYTAGVPLPPHAIPSRAGVGVGTTYRTLTTLENLGLVTVYNRGSTKLVELTDYGKEVAKLLLEAYKKAMEAKKKKEEEERVLLDLRELLHRQRDENVGAGSGPRVVVLDS